MIAPELEVDVIGPDTTALAALEDIAVPVRSCGLCGKELVAHQAKWCSRSCQKKAAWRRNGRTAGGPRIGPTDTSSPGVELSSPFEQLAALPALLAGGWLLSASSQRVTLEWTQLQGGQS
jgi:hypothetical protein